MGKFFEDTMQGLLEALEIEKGNLSLSKKEDMPAPTFVVSSSGEELIDEMTELRKGKNVSQRELQK